MWRDSSSSMVRGRSLLLTSRNTTSRACSRACSLPPRSRWRSSSFAPERPPPLNQQQPPLRLCSPLQLQRPELRLRCLPKCSGALFLQFPQPLLRLLFRPLRALPPSLLSPQELVDRLLPSFPTHLRPLRLLSLKQLWWGLLCRILLLQCRLPCPRQQQQQQERLGFDSRK